MQTLAVLVFFGPLLAIRAENACQKLAVCAIDRCIPASTDFPESKDVIKVLLHKANFGCILGPTCYDSCVNCESCQYAQDQMKRLILHEPTGGKCPDLEKCARGCLDDGVIDPFSCVFRERCVRHCFDNDCPQCLDIVKRVFTGYCYRSGFIEHFGQKCRPLFDQLAAGFVRDLE